MLRITVIASAAKAEQYYSQADYYLDEDAIPARWHGKGAELLGIHGEVAFEHFSELCRNRNPRTGEQVTASNPGGRRVAYDFSLSVSKSISVLYALAGDERILKAFRDSVQFTMAYLEQDAAVRVRKQKQDTDRTVGNLVYCDFVHTLSRPVGQDLTPQPQLHAHVVVQNMAYDYEEGVWKALQAGSIKADAPHHQAVFRSKLAEHIQALGYDINVSRGDFEVRGIPEAVIRKFSKRTEEIERLAKDLGITNPESKAKLGATSRKGKSNRLTWEQLKDRWHAELTPDEIKAVHFTHEAAREKEPTFRDRSAEAFQLALDHLLERNSVVRERDLVTEALKRGLGQATHEGIQQQLMRPDLLKAVYDKTPMVTTRAVMDEEQELIAITRRGRGRSDPNQLPASELTDQLNPGQLAAVHHILTSAARFSLVSGRAGVGKSTLLKAAKQALEEHGVHVTVLAPTSAASRGTLRQDGIDDAQTLQRFLVDEQMQEKAAGQQVILDEASLAGIKDMLALARIAEEKNIRVAYLGDVRQHKSVSRGNTLAVLEEFGGVKPVQVTEILRQSGEYRQTVALLAEGKAVEAFDRLQQSGAVRTDGYEALAELYVEHLQAGRKVLCVSPSHTEGADVTAAIRGAMQAKGLIDSQDHHYWRLVDLQTTEADRRDAGNDYRDKVAQFIRPKGPFKNGERVIVSDDNQELLRSHASAYRLYDMQLIPLAVNDRVRITAGGRSQCGHRLDTGCTYTVKAFASNGDVILNNGWRVGKEFGHLSHDWAVTSFQSQSRTTDALLVAQGTKSLGASNSSQFYVSMSRGRNYDHVAIFTDDPARLREAIAREDVKLTATRTIGRPKRRIQLQGNWLRRMRSRFHAAIHAQKHRFHKEHPHAESTPTRKPVAR
jgi:conjugative relaxase-like TrwC/TraI family protein